MSKGYVYIGVDHSGLFKIGIAKDPDKRARQFQTGNPTFKIFMRFQSNHPKQTESELHKHFWEKRVFGEWFSLDAKDLRYIANEYANKGMNDFAESLLDRTLKKKPGDGMVSDFIKRQINILFGVVNE